jgi:hypothetical protein
MTVVKLNAKEAHKRQKTYTEGLATGGYDVGLVVGKAFVESIRDLGYRSTGTAANELIDNAAQAGAENIHVVFGYPDGARKPNAIAIIDDGIGMIPEMTRAALLWGGTDRHGNRDLFGRYGYGLPSASVSQGRRVEVYSRPKQSDFHRAHLDLDEISEGKSLEEGRVSIAKPVVGELPDFVTGYIAEHFPGGIDKVRTVVVWSTLDHLTYTTSERLENLLLETFGVTYRNLLRGMSVSVNGKNVEAVDPLFITEGARFYDVDSDRAEAVEPLSFEIKDRDSKDVLGTVTARFSVMPPTFARKDKAREIGSRGKNGNQRWPIIRDHNGLIVLRAGRQIDVVTRGLPRVFVNYDRNIGIEVDFPPTLDEYFGITTNKQQITLSERILQLLDENDVWRTFDRLRKRDKELRADMTAEYDGVPNGKDEDEGRPSEQAMTEASEFDPPAPESERRSEREEQGREEAVKDLIEKGVPKGEAERVIEAVEKERPFRVEVEHNPEGPFYRVDLKGGQVVLLINSAHRFYTDVYAAVSGPDGARIRQALEVLLFVLGKSEIDASDDRELFYQSERQEWSRRLNVALAKLEDLIDLTPEEPEAAETGDSSAEEEPTEAPT